MSIPVIIVTGFLGCGKTSFLRHLIPLCKETGQRPALIVNEVGDVDVDGELLADLHTEQVKLVGGCVCCTLQAQLSETVWDILERDACDVIVIECSGLSNPVDVVSILASPALVQRIAVSHVVCLLNSPKWEILMKAAEVAKRQVEMANVLVLNKADMVEDGRRASIELAAESASPSSTKHWSEYGDIGREHLLKILNEPAPTRCACGCDHDHDHHHHSHELPASFCTHAIPLTQPITRQSLENLLTSLPENVIRAKGFANVEGEGWQVIQKSYDSVSIYPLGSEPSVGGVLVCIGQGLA